MSQGEKIADALDLYLTALRNPNHEAMFKTRAALIDALDGLAQKAPEERRPRPPENMMDRSPSREDNYQRREGRG